MAYRRARFRPGDELPARLFGAWRLHERVDAGGNGELWLAQSTIGGIEVAVKILTRLGGDGYARFKREVGTLEEMLMTDLAVVPVLDAHLPDQATRHDPPWYCMPFVTVIRHALRDAAPREIVRAILRIADTLSRLAEEHNIHHRDIKPENLFFYDGAPAIGDFGLVLRGDDVPITEAGRSIGGPRNYVPDEVRFNRADIDWERVDVFCLAKTLWVLIAGADFPPGGRIRAGGIYSLERQDNVHDAYLNELDAIIERATAEDPAERFDLQGFREAMSDWLDALEIREGIVAADARARTNKYAALRWIIGWAGSEDANFGRGLISLAPPEASSVFPGLTNADLAEALESLQHEGMIEGEPVVGAEEIPAAWINVFPAAWAVEQVEDQRALEARVAPVLRSLAGHPLNVLSLSDRENVALGAQMTGPNAYLRLRYLRDRGWITFTEVREGGGRETTLTNVRVTDAGRRRVT
jgi:hypothetical protein